MPKRILPAAGWALWGAAIIACIIIVAGDTRKPPPPPPAVPMPPETPPPAPEPIEDRPIRLRVLEADEKVAVHQGQYWFGAPDEEPVDADWREFAGREFPVTDIPEGKVKVGARARGRQPRFRTLTIEPGRREPVTIVLGEKLAVLEVRTRSVHGGRTSQDPGPLELSWTEEGEPTSAIVSCVSRQGRLEIDLPVRTGEIGIAPQSGYAPVTLALEEKQDFYEIDLVPAGSFAVRGTVVDSRDQPAERAAIRMTVAGEQDPRPAYARNGEFEFTRVPPGKVTLWTEDSRLGAGEKVSFDYDGLADREVALHLPAGATIRALVPEPEGGIAGRVGMHVSIERLMSGTGSHRAISIERIDGAEYEDGRLVLRDVPAGDCVVQVAAEGFLPFSRKLTVEVGKTYDITADLDPGRIVRFRFRDRDRELLARETVNIGWTHTIPEAKRTALTRSGVSHGSRRLMTDARGVATATCMPDQITSFTAHWARGYYRSEKLRLPAEQTAPIEITIPGLPTVEGRIVERGVKLKRRGFVVLLANDLGNMGLEPLQPGWDDILRKNPDDVRGLPAAFAPRDKRFRFENVMPTHPAGPRLVRLIAAGAVAAPVPVQAIGEKTVQVTLVATEPGQISGRVLGPDGRPAGNHTVYARPASLPPTVQGFTETSGPDGRFHFWDLWAGEWILTGERTMARSKADIKVAVNPGRTTKTTLRLSEL